MKKSSKHKASRKEAKQWVTVAEFAAHLKVNNKAVYKAIRSDRIEAKIKNGVKVLDLKEATEAWEANRKRYPDKHLHLDDLSNLDVFQDFDDNQEITADNASLHRKVAAAKREKWLALQAELEYKEAAGQLVSVEKVKRDAFAIGRRTRDHILNIPDRIAADLVGITDQAVMHAKLTQELTGALVELCDSEEPEQHSSQK